MAFESARAASVVYIMCTLMGMYAKTQQNHLKTTTRTWHHVIRSSICVPPLSIPSAHCMSKVTLGSVLSQSLTCAFE